MSTPYWHRPTTDYQVAEFPAGEQVDVAVVGAGFTGLTTALLLATEGRSVVVLEAHTVGAGASGATTAKVSVLQGNRLSTLRSRHGLDTARDYAHANQYGLNWWAQFCEAHGVSVQRRRAVTFARGARGTAHLLAEQQTLEELGLPARWHEQLDVPFPARAAVELPDQLQFDPAQALAALARAATDQGVRIVEHSRVTGLPRRSTGASAHVQVRTDAGMVTARDVVLATASPVLDHGVTAASMEAERSYLCAFEYPGGLPEGMYVSVESPARSLRSVPVSGDREVLLVGGNGHRTGSAGSTGAKLDSLRVYAEQHFPGAELIQGWSAQDYHPVTLLPKAGPLPWGRGRVQFAGGYSKWGLSGAPAAARIVADRIARREPDLSFGRPGIAGTLRTAVPMQSDLPVHLAAGAIRAAVRSPRPTLLPTAEATADDGRACRVSLLCPHMGAVLAWNEAERSWDCPWHGSRFSACGELLEGPATRDLPSELLD